jgi:hypothetical protein
MRRHSEQRDDERLRQDLLSLKAEQQDERRKQRHQRKRLKPVEEALQRLIGAGRQPNCQCREKARCRCGQS